MQRNDSLLNTRTGPTANLYAKSPHPVTLTTRSSTCLRGGPPNSCKFFISRWYPWTSFGSLNYVHHIGIVKNTFPKLFVGKHLNKSPLPRQERSSLKLQVGG